MPLHQYQLNKSNSDAWYIGPFASDFAAAFSLGGKPGTINSGNAEGIALAAIQGLGQQLDETVAAQAAEIARLEAEQAADRDALAQLRQELAARDAENTRLRGGEAEALARLDAALRRLEAAAPVWQAAR